jgi:hypothetical protein
LDPKKSFIDSLVDHRDGGAYAELEEQFKKLNLAVQATGRKGSISVTLVVEPTTRKGEVIAINCDDIITAKIPTNPKRSTVFFINADGTLTRNDPRQMTMAGVRDLDAMPQPEAKDIR